MFKFFLRPYKEYSEEHMYREALVRISNIVEREMPQVVTGNESRALSDINRISKSALAFHK